MERKTYHVTARIQVKAPNPEYQQKRIYYQTNAKIMKDRQNSFYGVLGAEGCRYARTELAGAITSFGKKYLTMARDFFESRGQRVLYGDTDSVFILSGTPEGINYRELMAMGQAAAEELNLCIMEEVRKEYNLESYLRIRCEKAYKYLLIPRLKGNQSGVGRGRAKGYAGLLLSQDGETSVEVKGMEAVRSDFTPLVRDFQLTLLELVFQGAGEIELHNLFSAEIAALKQGRRDDKLVYRKTLRSNADGYATETPQVKAARMMGWTNKKGRISYIMTKDGAMPVDALGVSIPDYDHYILNQLLPIAASIADALGFDAHSWIADKSQFELDFY